MLSKNLITCYMNFNPRNRIISPAKDTAINGGASGYVVR